MAVNETEDEVTCQCDHLTSFSILLVRVHITICKQVMHKVCIGVFINLGLKNKGKKDTNTLLVKHCFMYVLVQ